MRGPAGLDLSEFDPTDEQVQNLVLMVLSQNTDGVISDELNATVGEMIRAYKMAKLDATLWELAMAGKISARKGKDDWEFASNETARKSKKARKS